MTDPEILRMLTARFDRLEVKLDAHVAEARTSDGRAKRALIEAREAREAAEAAEELAGEVRQAAAESLRHHREDEHGLGESYSVWVVNGLSALWHERWKILGGLAVLAGVLGALPWEQVRGWLVVLR